MMSSQPGNRGNPPELRGSGGRPETATHPEVSWSGERAADPSMEPMHGVEARSCAKNPPAMWVSGGSTSTYQDENASTRLS
jgi:hypothetical protein